MFEDSTFASTNSIHTRSRAGFFAAIVFESSILLVMVLIPLLYPQALPNLVNLILMEAPAPPVSEARPQARPASPQTRPAVFISNPFQAPRVIPHGTYIPDKQGPVVINPEGMLSGNRSGSGISFFGPAVPVAVVHPPAPRAVRLSSLVVEGMLVHKTIPVYPQIAVSTRTQGTVVLQATISRNGTIENLHVVSGPAMLQQAALDAVSTWRYRPYMLNGQTIEVETMVNVVFKIE